MKECKLILSITAAVCVAGCNSDPYGEQAKYVSPEKPKEKTTVVVMPTYAVDGPSRVEFTENVQGRFTVKGLASQGDATIRLIGLPNGASFDRSTGIVTWTPGPSAGHDPQNPVAQSRQYSVRAEVLGPNDDAAKNDKDINLVVFAAPSTLSVMDASPMQEALNEGQEFRDTFRIQSSENTNGPFVVTSSNLPNGAVLTQSLNQSGSASVVYQPRFDAVKTNDSCTLPGSFRSTVGCKEINWQLVVTDPSGKTAILPVRWFVIDRTQTPRISAPSQVTATNGKAVFYVHVEDVNQEDKPVLSVDPSTNAQALVLSSAPASAITNAYQFYQVTWTNANRRLASPQELALNACELGLDRTQHACSTATVIVNF